MEELKKLIDVLERKGKRSASALLNYLDTASLETRLYQLAQAETDKDEAELIVMLYDEPAKQGAFRMLKSRVKQKLYNQLFFLDLENSKLYDELASAELKCSRILYLAELLRKVQEIKLAEQQLNKVLSLAKETKLIKYEIDALEQLRILYAEHNFKRKTYDACVESLSQAYKKQEFEKVANDIYFENRFKLKLGVETAHEAKAELIESIYKLKKLWETSGSDSVFKKYHRLKLWFYELTGDFETLIVHLKEVFSLYSIGEIHPLYISINFNRFLLCFSYLRSKQYAEGLLEAEILKNSLEESTHNWFAHMENYFLLAVHSKNYQKARELLTEVFTNKNLKNRNQFSQERWALYYKSLNYISGFTIPIKTDLKLKHVPQDRKGFNVWNLILDFIFILEKKETELIEREIDRVRKFISKYLGAKEDARTKLFLKMLQVAGREYENSKACKRKGTYLFNKLQQTPAPGIAYAETEIIPYEHLWELILQRLENNK